MLKKSVPIACVITLIPIVRNEIRKDFNCCKTVVCECCTVVPKTCADTTGAQGGVFDCAGHANAIDAAPAGITCAAQDSGCTATECCTVGKTCDLLDNWNISDHLDCIYQQNIFHRLVHQLIVIQDYNDLLQM